MNDMDKSREELLEELNRLRAQQAGALDSAPEALAGGDSRELETEAALRQSEQNLKRAQAVAKIGSWRLNLNANELTWSDEIYRIFGRSNGNPLTYNDFLEYIHPQDRAYVEESWEAALRGSHYHVEHRIIVNGETRWVSEKAELVLESHGMVAYGTVQDITERKQAEAEKAILEEQLHQAQKMESIGRLAGGVAHDFNNLLTVIQGFSEIVQDALPQDSPLKESVSEIQRAADSAEALTTQLLAFSRKQVVSPKPLDLNGVVTQSDKMLRRIIGEDIELTFIPGQIDKVMLDPGLIDHVLINLAVNSRDAMPDGGKVTIETDMVSLEKRKCRTCGHLASGEYVLLAISDNGTGMDATTAESIFEPFFTTKEKGKGTGLGLSTIHGIVHQHNGHINVYSEPGEGTTFKIYFPLAPNDATGNVSAEPHSGSDIRGHETILLVEDQYVVLQLAARALREHGYSVITAENGSEAYARYHETKDQVDLLLTDVIMPQMGGKQLYDRLQTHAPELKALFMSGYAGNAIVHHGVLDKGINYIQKPFKALDLVSKVRHVLDTEPHKGKLL